VTVLQIEGGQARVELTKNELIIFNNALNEVCNALDQSEFSTRMGVEPEEARALLRNVSTALSSINEELTGQ
jgi:hypothetical protein